MLGERIDGLREQITVHTEQHTSAFAVAVKRAAELEECGAANLALGEKWTQELSTSKSVPSEPMLG